MKKLITIILVLVMLVSMLALPAMASEIQPRYPAIKCTKCGGPTTYLGMYKGYYRYSCSNCNMEILIAP